MSPFLPAMQRQRGYVFVLLRQDGEPMARHMLKVSKFITAIGRKAGVVVNHSSGKCASAHDLRRAFGQRWSKLLMPADLKTLMRHAIVERSMSYNTGQTAESAAEQLWEVAGKQRGSTPSSETSLTSKNH